MKVVNYFLLGLSGIFVVFFMMMYFYGVAEKYDINQTEIGKGNNISVADFEDSLNDAEQTAGTMESIFDSDSPVLTAYNLVFKGLPSAGKTIYHGTRDSVKLELTGLKGILGAPAYVKAIGIIIVILLIVGVVAFWDWATGKTTGTSGG